MKKQYVISAYEKRTKKMVYLTSGGYWSDSKKNAHIFKREVDATLTSQMCERDVRVVRPMAHQ